jgi:hypothetical protein
MIVCYYSSIVGNKKNPHLSKRVYFLNIGVLTMGVDWLIFGKCDSAAGVCTYCCKLAKSGALLLEPCFFLFFFFFALVILEIGTHLCPDQPGLWPSYLKLPAVTEVTDLCHNTQIFIEMGSIFVPGWPGAWSSQILSPQLARITGVSHWCPTGVYLTLDCMI